VTTQDSGVARPRTIVITGASSGIGLAAAEQLAVGGDLVVLVGRDERRLAAAADRVRAAGSGTEPGHFQADFERLADVRALADHLLTTYPQIDVLANNAGMATMSHRRTVDGHEATIQANHLAHFLLSTLLRERLRGKRIVNTSVRPAVNARIDPDRLDRGAPGYRGIAAYQSSKAANVLFAMEAARRWPDIMSLSLHPGVVRTDIGRHTAMRYFFRYAPLLISPENSARRLGPTRHGTGPRADQRRPLRPRQPLPAEPPHLQRGQRGATLDSLRDRPRPDRLTTGPVALSSHREGTKMSRWVLSFSEAVRAVRSSPRRTASISLIPDQSSYACRQCGIAWGDATSRPPRP
jgi:NAD(P)-dependent dehydrogenase (short-subunit alcohol dehydrogenase family)